MDVLIDERVALVFINNVPVYAFLVNIICQNAIPSKCLAKKFSSLPRKAIGIIVMGQNLNRHNGNGAKLKISN